MGDVSGDVSRCRLGGWGGGEGGEEVSYMPRLCHVYATLMQRICHVYAVYAMYMPCICHVYAMYMPCICHVYATSVAYNFQKLVADAWVCSLVIPSNP